MLRLCSILFPLLAILPATGAAAETCPWLNAATASGVLGSGVTVTVTVTHETANREDMACRFERTQGNLTTEMRINVLTMDTPRSEFTSHAAVCGANAAPLKAIGNEAVICEPDEIRNGWHSAQVIGRVRNRIFTIVISTSESSAAATTLREKARGVAEQVAGFLF